MKLIDDGPIRHVPVTREEEGVGIAAGAALAGGKPLLLMQNSGLGNCVNALASLTGLYELPLVSADEPSRRCERAHSRPEAHGAGSASGA